MLTAIMYRTNFSAVTFALRALLLCAVMVSIPSIMMAVLPFVVAALVAAAPVAGCIAVIGVFAYVTYPK